MVLNRGLHGEKPAIDYLRYVTVTVKVAADGGQCMGGGDISCIHTYRREKTVYNSSRTVIHFSFDVKLRICRTMKEEWEGSLSSKVVPVLNCHTMKNGGIAPCTLNLSTKMEISCQFNVLGKDLPVHIVQKDGWAPEVVWML
jgi:hypothetical protein